MIKKILILITSIILLASCIVVVGCDNSNNDDAVEGPYQCEIYTLKEAYESGRIAKSSLIRIAEFHNYAQSRILVSTEIKKAIQQESYNNYTKQQGFSEYEKTPTDFVVEKYYGKFEEYYALVIDSNGIVDTTVNKWEYLDGVGIHYTTTDEVVLAKITPLVLTSETENENTTYGQFEGKFYSLKSAYQEGYITKDDLKSIAYYFNTYNVQRPTINSQVESAIKQVLCDEHNARYQDTEFLATPDDFSVPLYFGKYGNCYAVSVDSTHWDYTAEIIDKWEYIDGVGIHYQGHYVIEIFK